MTRALRSLAMAMAMTAGATHLGALASASDLQSAARSPGLESVLGKDVSTLREGDSGRVIDVLIDGHGRVRAAVVEFGSGVAAGGFGVSVAEDVSYQRDIAAVFAYESGCECMSQCMGGFLDVCSVHNVGDEFGD